VNKREKACERRWRDEILLQDSGLLRVAVLEQRDRFVDGLIARNAAPVDAVPPLIVTEHQFKKFMTVRALRWHPTLGRGFRSAVGGHPA